MSAMAVSPTKKEVRFKDENGLIQVEVEEEMRPYAYGERRKPAPKPEDWMTA